jgi:hypothetical protein
MKKDFSDSLTEEFANGAARAFWVMAWASAAEQRGKRLPPGDLTVHSPPTPLSAYVAAGELIGRLAEMNKAGLHELARRAEKAERMKHGDLDGAAFGHALAMESLGTGVSWFDDHKAFDIRVPYMEYSAGSTL